jgi:hypothetical protein
VRRDEEAAPGFEAAGAKAGKLAYLQSYLLKAERDLVGLLGGPWAALPGKQGQGQGQGQGGSGGGAQPQAPAPGYWASMLAGASDPGPQQPQDQRQVWVDAVRNAGSVGQLARLAVQLEAAICRDLDVLAKGWDPVPRRAALRRRQEAEAKAAVVMPGAAPLPPPLDMPALACLPAPALCVPILLCRCMSRSSSRSKHAWMGGGVGCGSARRRAARSRRAGAAAAAGAGPALDSCSGAGRRWRALTGAAGR